MSYTASNDNRIGFFRETGYISGFCCFCCYVYLVTEPSNLHQAKTMLYKVVASLSYMNIHHCTEGVFPAYQVLQLFKLSSKMSKTCRGLLDLLNFPKKKSEAVSEIKFSLFTFFGSTKTFHIYKLISKITGSR